MSLFFKKSKKFFSDLRIRASERLIPLDIYFEVTYKCNLNCVHCYIIRDYDRKELKFNEICLIIDQLKEAGCILLTFTGGELFTRNDMFDILSYARNKGFLIRFITNGTLVTSSIADKIKQIRPLSVSVSLYGASERTYKKITGSSQTYRGAIKGIKLLVKRDIKVNLKVPLLKYNVGEYSLFENLRESLGVSSIQFGSLLHSKYNGSLKPLEHEIPLSLIHPLVIKYYLENYKKDELLDLLKRQTVFPITTCDAGRSGCAISAYGDVSPCIKFRIKGFNLRSKSFSEIWHSKEFDKLRAPCFLDFSECQSCKIKNFCSLCYAEFHKSNPLRHRPDICQFAKINKGIYDFLTKLIKKEAH